jgi:ABC-type branched-subunit amino acid transport system substrate-binding protein
MNQATAEAAAKAVAAAAKGSGGDVEGAKKALLAGTPSAAFVAVRTNPNAPVKVRYLYHMCLTEVHGSMMLLGSVHC